MRKLSVKKNAYIWRQQAGTLGTHTQQGLRYLVSVSVRMSVSVTSYNAHNKASAGHEKDFKFGVFFCFVQELWCEKANMLMSIYSYTCSPRHSPALMQRPFA